MGADSRLDDAADPYAVPVTRGAGPGRPFAHGALTGGPLRRLAALTLVGGSRQPSCGTPAGWGWGPG